MKKMFLAVGIGLMAAVAMAAPLSKYAGAYGGAATTSAAVTFAPSYGQTVVSAVDATTDKLGAQIKFYARTTGTSKYAPTANATNGATVIAVANPSANLTNNDTVVYCHKDGTTDYRTLSSVTDTNVTLSSGIGSAGVAGDFIYEVSQQGQILAGTAGAGTGTNVVRDLTGDLFVCPADSPLYVVLDGTSNTVLQVSVK